MKFSQSSVACLLVLLTTVVSADDFVPTDEVLSAPGRSLSDPEFDEVNHRATWQFGPNPQVVGTLLVADVDPDTGEILDPQSGLSLREGGRGRILDQQLVERTVTGNGPEWAISAAGGQIVYTRFNENNEPSIAVATFDGENWDAGLLPFSNNRFTPKGSRFAADSQARVGYYGFVNGPNGLEVRLGTRLLERAGSETITDVQTGGGNFLPGEAFFLTTAFSPGGLTQVHVYDPKTEAFEQVTFDAGGKLQSPEPWIAPDFAEKTLFTVNTNLGRSGQARVYSRPDAGDTLTWQLEAAITSPVPGKPYVKSPRPFVFEGKSYITFIVQPGPGRSTAGEIWIADVDPDPETRFLRKVSEGGGEGDNDVRFDPETFVTTNGPIIYYTHVIDGVPVLRRAQTGLTPTAQEAPVASFTALPDPARPGTNIDFDGSASTNADGEIVSWDWDFEDDGVFSANGVQVVTSYSEAGSYTVRLRVTDDQSLSDETTMTIEVVEQP